jgi:hypothetical protein
LTAKLRRKEEGREGRKEEERYRQMDSPGDRNSLQLGISLQNGQPGKGAGEVGRERER